MPNWYVADDVGSFAIPYTSGEELKHVGPFDTKEKWKRKAYDTYNPPTPEDRYKMGERDRKKNWKWCFSQGCRFMPPAQSAVNTPQSNLFLCAL